MIPAHEGISFYFFDFDDNLMVLPTRIFVRNTLTGDQRGVSTTEFVGIEPWLGRPGQWENYALFDGSFRDFRDALPGSLANGQAQPFLADIQSALAPGGTAWQGPSWKFFLYACEHRRPVSIVTARGHSRETLRTGIRLLVERGLLPCEPCYHTLYPVGNDDVRRELGDSQLQVTTPALKRLAILGTVEAAISAHGAEAPLRFGMSDDDPQNVSFIIRAMCKCKQRHPAQRFFVVDTHLNEEVKLEVFPVDYRAG